jgi:hypothetical protein
MDTGDYDDSQSSHPFLYQSKYDINLEGFGIETLHVVDTINSDTDEIIDRHLSSDWPIPFSISVRRKSFYVDKLELKICDTYAERMVEFGKLIFDISDVPFLLDINADLTEYKV